MGLRGAGMSQKTVELQVVRGRNSGAFGSNGSHREIGENQGLILKLTQNNFLMDVILK